MVGILLYVVSILAVGCWIHSEQLPPDSEMIKTFNASQNEFLTLLKMSNEDSTYAVITSGYTGPAFDQVPAEKNIAGPRFDAYKKIFTKLGIIGLTRLDNRGSIMFTRGGLHGFSPRSKGYAYLLEEPSPVLESLNANDVDEFYRTQKDKELTLSRRLKKNWYLFFR